MQNLSRYAVLASVILVTSGCIGVGGRVETTVPTMGKQLVDLKTALDSGALTEQEYEQAKAQIILNGPEGKKR